MHICFVYATSSIASYERASEQASKRTISTTNWLHNRVNQKSRHQIHSVTKLAFWRTLKIDLLETGACLLAVFFLLLWHGVVTRVKGKTKPSTVYIFSGRGKREKVKPNLNRCVCVDSVLSVVRTTKDSRIQALSDLNPTSNRQKMLTCDFPSMVLFCFVQWHYRNHNLTRHSLS